MRDTMYSIENEPESCFGLRQQCLIELIDVVSCCFHFFLIVYDWMMAEGPVRNVAAERVPSCCKRNIEILVPGNTNTSVTPGAKNTH